MSKTPSSRGSFISRAFRALSKSSKSDKRQSLETTPQAQKDSFDLKKACLENRLDEVSKYLQKPVKELPQDIHAQVDWVIKNSRVRNPLLHKVLFDFAAGQNIASGRKSVVESKEGGAEKEKARDGIIFTVVAELLRPIVISEENTVQALFLLSQLSDSAKKKELIPFTAEYYGNKLLNHIRPDLEDNQRQQEKVIPILIDLFSADILKVAKALKSDVGKELFLNEKFRILFLKEAQGLLSTNSTLAFFILSKSALNPFFTEPKGSPWAGSKLDISTVFEMDKFQKEVSASPLYQKLVQLLEEYKEGIDKYNTQKFAATAQIATALHDVSSMQRIKEAGGKTDWKDLTALRDVILMVMKDKDANMLYGALTAGSYDQVLIKNIDEVMATPFKDRASVKEDAQDDSPQNSPAPAKKGLVTPVAENKGNEHVNE